MITFWDAILEPRPALLLGPNERRAVVEKLRVPYSSLEPICGRDPTPSFKIVE
jgi:hypothetical protein